MASSSCLTSLVLVMVIGVVHSGPMNLACQHAVDTCHIPNDILIDCLINQVAGEKCRNIPKVPEAPGCKCVHRTRCLATGGLAAIVNVKTSCSDPYETCCKDSTNLTNITPAVIISPTEYPTTSTPILPYEPRCGRHNPKGHATTMIGFEENQAQFGQFPWMAAVMTTATDADGLHTYICGASLIRPNVVLTVAHHVDDKKATELTVRLGEWNLRNATEHIPHQDIKVKSIVLHPDFSNLEYDVALLFLETEAVLGLTVDTICLPNESETFDGASCYSSGWGKDLFGKEGKYQEILKSLKLPVVGHQQCQEDFRNTAVLGRGFNLHKSFMCAGGHGGADTCNGDGGSPLACPSKSDPSRYVLAGLVSWGIDCGAVDEPGAYASVSETVIWIRKNLPNDLPSGINPKTE